MDELYSVLTSGISIDFNELSDVVRVLLIASNDVEDTFMSIGVDEDGVVDSNLVLTSGPSMDFELLWKVEYRELEMIGSSVELKIGKLKLLILITVSL